MRGAIPKIRRRLDLAEYSPELKDREIWVWVNPPRRIKSEILQAAAQVGQGMPVVTDPDRFNWISRLIGNRRLDRSAGRLIDSYAVLWSDTEQGESYANGNGSEHSVRQFAEFIVEEDPALWAYLVSRTWLLINEFLDNAKKVRTTPR
jgi:hypothetical protein